MTIRAGALRHRFQIKRRSLVGDDDGGQVESWPVIGEAWGRLEPVSSRHGFRGHQEATRVTHLVTLRYTGVNGADRLALGSREFRIAGVRNVDEKDRELELTVEEVAPVTS